MYRARLDVLVRRLRAEAGAHVGHPPDAEARYLIGLIAAMEAKRGVIQYVELAAEAEATAEHRPEPVTEDEWGFVWLLRDPGVVSAPPPGGLSTSAADTNKERLASVAAAAERFPQFVIVGDPGAGKTTALRRLIRDAASRRLKNPHAAPLPVLLDLPGWRDEPTPADLVRSRWVLPSDPAASLRTGEVHLFLDGLNEMGDRAAYHAEQLRQWLKSPDGPARIVFTCRVGDYASKTLRLDDLPTVLIQDLEEPQVRHFAVNYLQTRAPEFLGRVLPGPQAMNGGAGLLPLAQNPYMLSALIFLFEHAPGGDLPRNTGTLFRGLARALWEREGKRHTPGWVLFEKAEAAFAKLAFAMIDEDRGTAVSEQYATGQLGSYDLLVAALSATYLSRDGETVRFYHQLLQEYFAAVAARAAGLPTLLKGASYQWMPGGVRSDPLEWPARKATKWDAVIVALCGIVEKPDELIAAVLESDPSLAAGCVASGVLLDPETRRKTIEQMVTLLRDRGGRVSVAMAHAIQRLGDSAAAPGLVAALRDGLHRANSSQDILQLAAMALGGCPGPIAMAGLTEALGCESKRVCIRAIQSLGRIGDESVIRHLSGVLWDDEEVPLYFSAKSSRQGEAVRSLIQIGGRARHAVVAAMLDGLRNPEPRIRTACANVLGSVDFERGAGSMQVALGDGSAVGGLLDALVYDADSRVTHAAGIALERFRDVGAVPQLLDGLRHADPRARAASGAGLGSIGDPSGVPGLLDALAYDLDARVRAESARALGAIGDSVAVPGLLDAFRHGHDFNVLDAASTALTQFRDSRIVSVLIDGLRDPVDLKRILAAHALAEIADVAAVADLLAALGDEALQVRGYAGYALRRIGRPAVRGLIGALDSSSHLARREAALALKSIGDHEAIPALERRRDDEDHGVAQAAADAIATLRSVSG